MCVGVTPGATHAWRRGPGSPPPPGSARRRLPRARVTSPQQAASQPGHPHRPVPTRVTPRAGGGESAASAPPPAELAGAGSPPRPRRRGRGAGGSSRGAAGAAPLPPSPPPLSPPGKGPVTGPGNPGALRGAAAHALPFCARDAARTRRRRREARPGPSAPARRLRRAGPTRRRWRRREGRGCGESP